MCACRDMPKAEATASAINRRLPRTVPPSSSPCGRASPAPAPLDLASLASVRAFVDAFERERGEEGEEEQKRNEDRRLRRREPRLHVLVNNAGALFPKRELVDVWKREEQEGRGEGEGKRESLLVERTMATNHLGPFLLTALLLPTLKETGRAEGRPSRVVMVSSRLEKGKGEYLDCWVRDPTLTPAEDQDPKEEGEEEGGPVASPPYRPFLAYGASKLANLLAVREIHLPFCPTPFIMILSFPPSLPARALSGDLLAPAAARMVAARRHAPTANDHHPPVASPRTVHAPMGPVRPARLCLWMHARHGAHGPQSIPAAWLCSRPFLAS